MTYFDQAKSYVLSDSSVTDKSCQLSQHIAKLQAMSKWTFLVGVALLLGPASRGALAQGITATIVGTVQGSAGSSSPRRDSEGYQCCDRARAIDYNGRPGRVSSWKSRRGQV